MKPQFLPAPGPNPASMAPSPEVKVDRIHCSLQLPHCSTSPGRAYFLSSLEQRLRSHVVWHNLLKHIDSYIRGVVFFK
jgi:hypothetical protein